MGRKVTLGIVFIAIVGVAGFLFWIQQNRIPEGYEYYKNKELGIQFLIPENWNEIDSDTTQNYVLHSSNYSAIPPQGYGDPTILEGAKIILTQPTKVAESIANPDTFIAWLKGNRASNLNSSDEVLIDKIPALQSTYDDGNFIGIKFVREGSLYELKYVTNDFTRQDQTIIDLIVRSFAFTE